MRTRELILLPILWLGIGGADSLHAREPALQATKVPRWDLRGSGPLPSQGIACLDIDSQAFAIAVGTIAPPGDPNVVLLDGDGNVIRQQHVGQRWINAVGLDSGLIRAVCTMPAGKAGDNSEIFRSTSKDVTPADINWRRRSYPESYFHYGEHSNHVARLMTTGHSFTVAVNGDQVHWLDSHAMAAFPLPEAAIPIAVAVGGRGIVVVGTAVASSKSGTGPGNLHVLQSANPRMLWSRAVNKDTDEAPPLEKGRYGAPTLPDGRREALPQRDEQVGAPLAVALHVAASPDILKVPHLVAAADYQGWQRWVRSSATGKDENLGIRFVPSRPAITIYGEKGQVVRRFAPETFTHPFWCDLQFSTDGKRLIVSPHSWTCRGLAGQPLLPADDHANDLYVLDIARGSVTRLPFPDAISDVAVSEKGVAVGCWDGRVYLLTEQNLTQRRLPTGIAVVGPALIRATRDGTRLVVAGANGVIRLLDATGREVWQTDLNKAVKPTLKPWVDKARAMPIAAGVWQLPGGRVESDLGGQRLIEAPDGLILIEAHAGLSFESEWAAIKAVGLDPMRVKYVLATHEHGDHAPGAYLWRVVTGAQFVCGDEMAYTLQHHVPLNSGYGFHPPVPTDVKVTEDTELDLAGQKVRALRIPGHTCGSMAWLFEKGGKSFLSFGDLIMPRGVLGYSGSINFSARDVLTSLRKLQALRPDIVLPGHGSVGDPTDTLGAGIDVGVAGGWGLIRPEKPDPYFRITQPNVVVAAWNIGATSAAFGDIDGDGRPDIAIVAPSGGGALLRIFLNRGSRFADQPDHEIAVPGVKEPNKVRILPAAKGKAADLFVAGESAALLIAADKLPKYKAVPLAIRDGNQVRFINVRGRKQTLIAGRFSGVHLLEDGTSQPRLTPFRLEIKGPYVDVQSVDVNGDGRPDLVTSYGHVYLRGPDGKLPAEPSLRLETAGSDWHFLAVGDFNGDKRPDIALLTYGMHGQTTARVFYNRGKVDKPFDEKPDVVIPLNPAQKNASFTLLRDTPVVCDWNGDGIDDLVVGRGQSQEVLILLGGRDGLDVKRSQTIALDYRTHYETGLFVGDFNGDGRPDLAVFGYTLTGVGWNGPPAAYIWLQPPATKVK
jgi:glyoxylase-like metal-dependent hydrolase (beta-lactamase superfamily II)